MNVFSTCPRSKRFHTAFIYNNNNNNTGILRAHSFYMSFYTVSIYISTFSGTLFIPYLIIPQLTRFIPSTDLHSPSSQRGRFLGSQFFLQTAHEFKISVVPAGIEPETLIARAPVLIHYATALPSYRIHLIVTTVLHF